MILSLALISLNLHGESASKVQRQLASINLESSKVTSALSQKGFIGNSQSLVNGLTKTTSYKCADKIQISELKEIQLEQENKKNPSTFKFNAVRMCFDQAGPGVVEVRYDGKIRDIAGKLETSDVQIKLIQDSND